MPRNSNLHEMVSDYSRCPCCVTEMRLGYASAYFNYDDKLFAVCKRHAVKWLVTGRALLHPKIPDLSGYSNLAEAFDLTEPIMPSTVHHRAAPEARSPAPRRALVGQKPISRPVSRPKTDAILEPPSAAKRVRIDAGGPLA